MSVTRSETRPTRHWVGLLSLLIALIVGCAGHARSGESGPSAGNESESVRLLKALGGEYPRNVYPPEVHLISRIAGTVGVATIVPAYGPHDALGGAERSVYVYCDPAKPTLVGVQYALDESLSIQQEQARQAVVECMKSRDTSEVRRALVCLVSGVWQSNESFSGECADGPSTFLVKATAGLPEEFRILYGEEVAGFLKQVSESRAERADDWIVYVRINHAPPGFREYLSHWVRVFRVQDRESASIEVSLEFEKVFGAPLGRVD